MARMYRFRGIRHCDLSEEESDGLTMLENAKVRLPAQGKNALRMYRRILR